ncbi:Cupredoxin-like domain-containing protein [Noviherbaspirillum humi]|uniref:Cupredoxin-like domain-containing protein n=1 Tax=Noviherbaspirillum humi TaxID=1688639 RepID=A0A239J476_9BURK|nr:cupredoxin domain-containing protein [Noviherbaspirillum humi]SNT00615.1 Cupredoxin-like domain-containing protein [Noviherbaspirillum humi]
MASINKLSSLLLPLLAAGAFSAVAATSTAFAADPEVRISIQEHKFSPAEVKVPANQRVKLIVLNKDDTPEEFESSVLSVEKIIPGGNRATIFIGPLKPGRYPFMGEFHQSTAQGVVVAE